MINSLTRECSYRKILPRKVQIDAVTWLESNWSSGTRCKILSLPTGSGKSLIAKTISSYNESKELRTVIITPQNMLIDQYIGDFPELNFLKGRQHYTCESIKDTCEVGFELNKESKLSCEKCPYASAKTRCYTDLTTIFNPISYYLLTRDYSYSEDTPKLNIDTIIVDEIQTLSSFLRELSTVKLWSHDIVWVPGVTSSIPKVIELLKTYTKKLSSYITHPNIDRKDRISLTQSQNKIDNLISHLTTESSFFICEETEDKFKGHITKCLSIKPKYVPPSIYKSFFKNIKHVILMSGTTFPFMWQELGFEKVDFIDLPSPISKERRMIFAPGSITLSFKETDALKRWDTIQELAQQVKRIVFTLHANESGVILLPYNLAKEIKPLLDEECFIHMDKTTKKAKIDKFLKGEVYGVGVFSGAYEGLSLNDHISRFTIIPKVPYPNLMDKIVNARLKDNEMNYSLETMTLVIQAAGRSVRSEQDYGVCYILDSNFLRLYSKTRSLLPNYFKESLIFSFPKETHLKLLNEFREEAV